MENVTKRFGDDVAVDNLSLEIEDGDFYSLLGPSGCGKTTTMRLIAGLEKAQEGKIWIDDKLVFNSEDNTFVPPAKRGVGMVFQNYALWPHMTVKENVVFGLEEKKTPKQEKQKKLKNILELLEIGELEERYPSELSGGQQQRVALARELIIDEKNILLMDEPLSNLDAKLRINMRIQLKKIHENTQGTVIYVTHDQIEALTLSTQMAVLNNGVLQQVNPPRDVFVSPKNFFVASFMGDSPINRIEAFIENDQINIYDFNIPVPTYAKDSLDNNQEVLLGIRPEELNFSDKETEWTIPGVVDSILPMGYETLVRVRIKGRDDEFINVEFDIRDRDIAKGMDVFVEFDPNIIHLFDKNDNIRIGEDITI